MTTDIEPDHHSTKIKVLIADDHPALRAGLATVVNGQPDMVAIGEVTNGVEAVQQCRALHPHVVLMDLRMPGGGGLEAIAEIVASGLSTRIIILTTYDLDEDIHRAFRAGAHAFLTKDSTMEEITDTIRRVHQGETILHPGIDLQGGKRPKGDEITPRELEVLQLLVKGHSNKEIASRLSISEDTVKTHVRVLFHKIGVNTRTEAAFEAVRSGLVYI